MAADDDITKPEVSNDLISDVENGKSSVKNSGFTIGGSTWVTEPYQGLTSAEVGDSRSVYGRNEIPKHTTPTYVLFLRQFTGFMPILIEVAAIISIALQDYPDFAIIVGMLIINACLGFREEFHAKKSLDQLSNSIESEVAVLRDGNSAAIPVSELVPGDLILLVGGTVIPADVKWVRGDSMKIDTAALTGEPIPRTYPSKEHGDLMLSGATVIAGECYAQVMATGTNTEIGAAQADVMKDKGIVVVSVFQKKIMVIVQITISFSLVLVVIVILVQGVARDGFSTGEMVTRTILDGLSILIAAIPIALPLVMQVNMALGASYLAKHHNAIVTSLPALQDIASMSILCSDKTGTLTTAKMSIIKERIYAAEDFTQAEVLLHAYLSANPDKKDDPIDRAIVQAFNEDTKAKEIFATGNYKQTGLIGFNPNVKRVVAFVSYDQGIKTIAKGLPAKIMDTSAGGEDDGELQWKVDGAENEDYVTNIEKIDRSLSSSGYKTIAIAVCEEDARNAKKPVFRFIGLLPMLDPPREDTKLTIKSLHDANISVKMITGDHVSVGKETARLVGLGVNIHPGESIRTNMNEMAKKEMIWEADGFAAVLPSDKREVVMTLRDHFGIVTGMTGDGVNDAPALSAAQVGIAVEGATDAAKNAADLILTEPGLSPIYGAVIESRRIFARIKSYVVYRIAASLTMVLELSLLIFISGCAINPLFVIILALLNDVSMIPVAYDRADATKKPQLPRTWNLIILSIFFALFHTAAAMVFFYGIGSNQRINNFDLGSLSQTCLLDSEGFVWLHLVLSTEIMIFSVRSPSFFFQSMPSYLLVLSVLFTIGPIGSVIARYYYNVPGANIGWIWLFNFVYFVILDFIKVGFKAMIGDTAGEVIKGDGIVDEKDTETNDVKEVLEKKMRYQVHSDSVLAPDERNHSIIMTPKRKWCCNWHPNTVSGFVAPINSVLPLQKPASSGV